MTTAWYFWRLNASSQHSALIPTITVRTMMSFIVYNRFHRTDEEKFRFLFNWCVSSNRDGTLHWLHRLKLFILISTCNNVDNSSPKIFSENDKFKNISISIRKLNISRKKFCLRNLKISIVPNSTHLSYDYRSFYTKISMTISDWNILKSKIFFTKSRLISKIFPMAYETVWMLFGIVCSKFEPS